MSTSTRRPVGRHEGRWTYGDSWDRFPVEPGQLWAVGPHRFAAGDLEMGDGLALLASPEVPQPGVGYVDPPWDPSNASSFRTKAGADNKADFSLLLRKVAQVMLHVTGVAFAEMGLRQTDAFVETIRQAGGHVYSVQQINDPPNKFTCNLVAFGHAPTANILAAHDPGKGRALTGLETPQWAIRHHALRGEAVLDCCVGRGLTAISAHMLDRPCVGLELNPRRLAVTIAKLVDQGAGEATVVGSIH